MTKLEELVETNTLIESADCAIFDGMSVIQMLTPAQNTPTFADMASSFMKYVVVKSRSISGVKDIHIVFDRYTENSLKMNIRVKRGDAHNAQALYIHENMPIPKDWKAFLSLGVNKTGLTNYYTDTFLKMLGVNSKIMRNYLSVVGVALRPSK
ncbi:MAG: hypothetical protein ABW185_25595 [Sedimenticola sp.]